MAAIVDIFAWWGVGEIPSSSVCSVLRPRLFPGPASTAVPGGNGASCGGKVGGWLLGRWRLFVVPLFLGFWHR